METPYKGKAELSLDSTPSSYDKVAPDTPDILQLLPPSLVVLSGKKDLFSPITASTIHAKDKEENGALETTSKPQTTASSRPNIRRRLLSDNDDVDRYLQRLQNNPMFGELTKILAEECLHMQTPTNLINVSWEQSSAFSTRPRNVHVAHLNLQKKFLHFRSDEKYQAAAREIESRYSKEVSKMEIDRYHELSLAMNTHQAYSIHETYDKNRLEMISAVTQSLEGLLKNNEEQQSHSYNCSLETPSPTTDSQSDSSSSSNDFSYSNANTPVDVLGLAMAAADVLPEVNNDNNAMPTSTYRDIQSLLDTFPVPRQDDAIYQVTPPLARQNTDTENRKSVKRRLEDTDDKPIVQQTTKRSRLEVPPSKPRQITPEATRILTEWYDNHVQYPYPAEEDVQFLTDLTRLSAAQVKKWMANKRVRCFNTLSITGNKHPIKAKLGGKRKPPTENTTVYKQLSEESRKVLSDWYDQHSDNPYPTEKEKKELAKQAGVTVAQIKSWFANRRSRAANRRRQVPNYFLEKFPEYSTHVQMVQVHRDQTRRRNCRPEPSQTNYQHMYF